MADQNIQVTVAIQIPKSGNRIFTNIRQVPSGIAPPRGGVIIPQIFPCLGIPIRSPYAAENVPEDADLVVILTEWPEVKELDLDKLKSAMKCPVVVDGRNVFEPAEIRAKGFDYHCIGRL